MRLRSVFKMRMSILNTATTEHASYYLSEELHGTMLAFRTLAAGILVAEKSVAT